MQKGPSESSAAAPYPEKAVQAQSRQVVSMRAGAFFPPSLAPVLDRGQRDKDAVGAPEVPTRRAVGQAILDHEPHCQSHHAMGVLTARGGESGAVRVKGLPTLRPVML